MKRRDRLSPGLASLVLVAWMTTLAGAAIHEVPVLSSAALKESSQDGRVFVGGVRRQDEIVVVDTRMLCGSCDPESLRSGLRVETYAAYEEVGCRRWQPSDLESFLAFDASVPTIVFVHGNQVTASDAKQAGLTLYRRMMQYGGDGPPIRLVIFSWPSAQVGGLLRDVRVKAARTGPAGCQLAWLLDQMPAETPISLVGFSFGARIITGGLHILAGGSLGHLALPQRVHPARPPMNVVLLSAALHAHWLGEGQYHGLAMSRVNQMLLVNNCRDPALRLYHLAFKGGRPQALGLRGPTCLSFEQRSKIQMRDVSRHVSRHVLFQYLCAPGVPAQIREYSTDGMHGGIQVAIANRAD